VLYLIFIVDPYPNRRGDSEESKVFWAAKASSVRPTGPRPEAGDVEFYLGRHWEERLPEFVRGVSELRNKWGTTGGA
jgi:hypothetical protein